MTVEKVISRSVEGGSQTTVKRASVDKKNKMLHVDKYFKNIYREEKA